MATTAALTAVENKIPNVSNLVENADYFDKIKEIESKYLTTSDYNKSTNNIHDEPDILKSINNSDLDKKDRNICNKSRIKSRAR